MSMEAMIWGAKLKVPSREKLVLMLMGNYANARAECWPSYSTLAASCAVSVGTVKRALKQLEEWGLVEVENRFHPNGKPRSNRYTLRIDRHAPPTALDGSTETPTPEDEEENDDETTTSEVASGGTVQADSIGRSHGESIPRSHTDTMVGVTETPTNRNNQLEPTPLNPPSVSEQPSSIEASAPSTIATAADRTNPPASVADAQGSAGQGKGASDNPREGFNKLEELYQQGSVIGFFGDRVRALKRWDKLSFEDKIAAVAKFPQYLNASKAQYARWQNSKADNRGRKPSIASASDYLGNRIFDSLPSPVQQSMPTPKPSAAWCAAVAASRRTQLDRDAAFVAYPSERFSRWNDAFRRASAGVLSFRSFTIEGTKRNGAYFASEEPPLESDFIEQQRGAA